MMNSSARLSPKSAHSTFRTRADGRVTHHAEWQPNPQNPSGFDLTQRVDTQYASPHSHFNKVTGEYVPTPHTQGSGIPGGVRPSTPNELAR
jgi:hypothetical protein